MAQSHWLASFHEATRLKSNWLTHLLLQSYAADLQLANAVFLEYVAHVYRANTKAFDCYNRELIFQTIKSKTIFLKHLRNTTLCHFSSALSDSNSHTISRAFARTIAVWITLPLEFPLSQTPTLSGLSFHSHFVQCFQYRARQIVKLSVKFQELNFLILLYCSYNSSTYLRLDFCRCSFNDSQMHLHLSLTGHPSSSHTHRS